jgi:hypothetical protein
LGAIFLQFFVQSWKQSGTAEAGAGEDPTVIIVPNTHTVNADKVSRREGRVELEVDDNADGCFDVVDPNRVIDCFKIILRVDIAVVARF